VVKVVCDPSGRALYFSRSPIPNLVRAEPEDLALLNCGMRNAECGFEEKERDGGCICSSPFNPQSAIRNPQSKDSQLSFWGFKHFGLYVYRREALLKFVKMPQTPLERIEKLEQLRFLENGMTIRVVETQIDSIGVDTPEDLEQARRLLAARMK
jgi:CMP-2-keto-3-deoxyoctulosonic acid synthetase